MTNKENYVKRKNTAFHVKQFGAVLWKPVWFFSFVPSICKFRPFAWKGELNNAVQSPSAKATKGTSKIKWIVLCTFHFKELFSAAVIQHYLMQSPLFIFAKMHVRSFEHYAWNKERPAAVWVHICYSPQWRRRSNKVGRPRFDDDMWWKCVWAE